MNSGSNDLITVRLVVISTCTLRYKLAFAGVSLKVTLIKTALPPSPERRMAAALTLALHAAPHLTNTQRGRRLSLAARCDSFPLIISALG